MSYLRVLRLSMAGLAALAISLPALASAGDQNTVKLANTVANCLQVYYAYSGHWPESWDEIEQSGIHQVALVNSAGISIDPDVFEIPVAGETVWMSGKEQNGGYVLELYLPEADANAATPSWQKPWVIDVSKTYDQKFRRFDELNELRGLDVRWTPHLADDARLRQFAITGLISDAFLQYYLNFGKYPTSMSQLIDAGYSPVDWSSINPLTDKPFRFDGSANDLLVLVGNEGDYYSDSSINVFPVLEDGEPLYAVGSFS